MGLYDNKAMVAKQFQDYMALSGKGWKLGMSNRKSYLSWIGINVDKSLIRDQNEFSSQFVK